MTIGRTVGESFFTILIICSKRSKLETSLGAPALSNCLPIEIASVIRQVDIIIGHPCTKCGFTYSRHAVVQNVLLVDEDCCRPPTENLAPHSRGARLGGGFSECYGSVAYKPAYVACAFGKALQLNTGKSPYRMDQRYVRSQDGTIYSIER